jgi:DNA-binding response OmpR family regulator
VIHLKLLIVEDNRHINQLLTQFARQDGHHVVQVLNAEDAIKQLTNQGFDVIITDLMLPDMQGEDLITQIRKVSDIYIIVISAKIDIHEKLDVFSIGADDYITKPFSVEEVMAKLKNLEKRIVSHVPIIQSYNHGKLKIQPLENDVWIDGKLIELTHYEYNILWQLISNRFRTLSRDQLIESCFSESEAFDRIIDVYIKNIRKKLSDDAVNPSFIKTVYGLGYQFIGEHDDEL